MNRFSLFGFILLLGFCSGVWGQTPADSNVTEVLTLEELLNIKTTVSSKDEVLSSDAPGSVSVYSRKDIGRLGYYTLSDLASITAGYSAFSAIGEETFETRGQKAAGFDNNKHLVLIDDIPFAHTRANRANAQEDLPLFFAERVEFLKGPGSALYGISAFYGVINISSPEVERNTTKVNTMVSFGAPHFQRRIMFDVVHRQKKVTTKIAASYYGRNGSLEPLGNGANPNALSAYYDNRDVFFLYYSHKIEEGKLRGLMPGVLVSSKTGGLGDFWFGQQNQTTRYNQISWQQISPYLKYARRFGKFRLTTYALFNVSTEKAYTMGFQSAFNGGYVNTPVGAYLYNVEVKTNTLFGELKYRFLNAPGKQGDLILGANSDVRYSTGNPENYSFVITNGPGTTFLPDPSFYPRSSTYGTYSVFGQYLQKWPLLSGLSLTIGGRLDLGRVTTISDQQLTNKYDQLSPRIAVVQKVSRNLSFKFLYGSALRAPLIKEVGVNEETRAQLEAAGREEVAAQVPNISSETFRSTEISGFCSLKWFSISLTGFINRTENALLRETFQPEPTRSVFVNNNGLFKAHGGELEMVFKVYKGILWHSNFAYAYSYDSEGNDLANIPRSKLYNWISFDAPGKVPISGALIHKWMVNYTTGVLEDFYNPTADPNLDNQLFGGYAVLDANLVWRFEEHFRAELQVRNLLNRDIRTPGLSASGQNNVPYQDRSFLISFGYAF